MPDIGSGTGHFMGKMGAYDHAMTNDHLLVTELTDESARLQFVSWAGIARDVDTLACVFVSSNKGHTLSRSASPLARPSSATRAGVLEDAHERRLARARHRPRVSFARACRRSRPRAPVL